MRDTTQLHPLLQAKIVQLKAECKKQGLSIGIGECLRTVAEQDALYAQGRTKPGKIVTNAKGSTYSSQHQWGIAFDFFQNVKGKEFDNSKKFFNKVGKIAESIGLGWGGSWTSIVDLPHCYLPTWGSTTTRLKSAYEKPETFKKIWLHVDDKVTCKASVYVRESVNGKKAKYDSLTKTLKSICTKQADGTAKFKVGKMFTIKKLGFSDTGSVWGQTSSGFWIPLIGKDGAYKFAK